MKRDRIIFSLPAISLGSLIARVSSAGESPNNTSLTRSLSTSATSSSVTYGLCKPIASILHEDYSRLGVAHSLCRHEICSTRAWVGLSRATIRMRPRTDFSFSSIPRSVRKAGPVFLEETGRRCGCGKADCCVSRQFGQYNRQGFKDVSCDQLWRIHLGQFNRLLKQFGPPRMLRPNKAT